MQAFPHTALPEFLAPGQGRAPIGDTSTSTTCTIATDGCSGVTLWSTCANARDTDPERRFQLELAPDATVIIGRMNGGKIEYLDPRYAPTPILPGTGRTILQGDHSGRDGLVSRGHFMLRGHAVGITLVNGVPRRGGGIRPPYNWTKMLAPSQRTLDPGEELLIERGAAVTILLPNDAQLTIRAEAQSDT